MSAQLEHFNLQTTYAKLFQLNQSFQSRAW